MSEYGFKAGPPPTSQPDRQQSQPISGGFWISNRVLFLAALAVVAFIAAGTFYFVHRAQQLEEKRIRAMWQQIDDARNRDEQLEFDRRMKREDELWNKAFKRF